MSDRVDHSREPCSVGVLFVGTNSCGGFPWECRNCAHTLAARALARENAKLERAFLAADKWQRLCEDTLAQEIISNTAAAIRAKAGKGKR